MSAKSGAPRPMSQRHFRGEQIKDEVYRQMFLVEEKRQGAEIELALVLLYAWQIADSTSAQDEMRDWLKKVSPICMEMIEAKMQAGVKAPPPAD